MLKDIEGGTSSDEERPLTYKSPLRNQNSIFIKKPIAKIKKVDAKTLDRIF